MLDFEDPLPQLRWRNPRMLLAAMKLQKRKTKATTKPNNLVKKLVTKDSVSSLMLDVRDSRLFVVHSYRHDAALAG